MNIDRRQLLIGGTCAALAGSLGALGACPLPSIPGEGRWHPLTRSLLERARRANMGCELPDRARAYQAEPSVQISCTGLPR